MIPGLAKLPYVERFKLMKTPSLVYRRLRGDLVEINKYMLTLKHYSQPGNQQVGYKRAPTEMQDNSLQV